MITRDKPVRIDLRDLTQVIVDTAIAMMGETPERRSRCLYSTPCIIGALMTKEEQQGFAGDLDLNVCPVGKLVENGYITFPNEAQVTTAQNIQTAFDVGAIEVFESLCREWVNAVLVPRREAFKDGIKKEPA